MNEIRNLPARNQEDLEYHNMPPNVQRMLKRILKEKTGKLPSIKEMPEEGKNFINDRI
jgi:hypothetical protein